MGEVVSFGDLPEGRDAHGEWSGGCGCTYSLGTIGGLDTAAIEEEAHGVGRLALSLTERVHEFL